MKNENCIDTIGLTPQRRSFGLPPWIVKAIRSIGVWMDRSQQRQRLFELDDAALKDIGLTRDDVQIEIAKPFWRL